MVRTTNGPYTRQKKKKLFKIAKGYYGNKRNRWRMVIQQVEKSLRHAYRDRKGKKRTYRQLWITRINALVRESGISYSRFINGLRKANIDINRKMLSELAIHDVEAFKQLIEIAKTNIPAEHKKTV